MCSMTFSVLYKLLQVQEISHEPLKCHCIHLYLQFDSDLGETDLLEELHLFGKSTRIISSRRTKIHIWNNVSEINPHVVTVRELSLTALVVMASAQRSFSKLKMTNLFVIFHLPRVTDVIFNYINENEVTKSEILMTQ